jgi:hypothetical protein
MWGAIATFTLDEAESQVNLLNMPYFHPTAGIWASPKNYVAKYEKV